MARCASGSEQIEAARKLLKNARTADELRQAQAVLLPLELGLDLEQTAQAIGRSRGYTCTLRTRFAKIQSGKLPTPRKKSELRNHAKADLEQEKKILDEVLSDAMTGGVVVIPRLKPVIEQKLGKSLALSTLYNMLARHGWRKLAPDTKHPQGNPQAREDWKKNSPMHWQKLQEDS